MYISIYDIEKAHKDNKNKKLNFSGADERELEEALQKSLQDYNSNQKSNNDDEDAPGVGTILNGGQAAKSNKPEF